MTFVSLYAIIVGFGIFAQWAFFIKAGQVPELKDEPIRIRFHLAAEWATAAVLIGAGVAMLAGVPWGSGLMLFALGMLMYTIIVSPGYFAQKGQWPFVAMFAVLVVLTLVSLSLLLLN